MIRCIILVVACIVLHVAQPSVLNLADNLHFANAQTASLVLYLEWGLASWAVSDCNAALNRWAENRWMWSPDTSNWNWENEVAVVTGGSNGIGAGIAKELTTHGIKVAVLDVVPLSGSFTADQRKLVHYYHCDIASPEAIHTSAQAIRSELGSPSILINNAGIGNSDTILDIPPERLRKIFDINILSHWSTVKEFLPGMLKAQKGHIMAVSSLAAFVSLAGAVDYGCTKSAMLSFHEGLAQEIKHRYNCPQIRTTIVHPNWTRSAITEAAPLASLKRNGVKFLGIEYVAKKMVDQIIAGKSGQLILGPCLTPRIRALPAWLQELIRDGQAKVVNGSGTTIVE